MQISELQPYKEQIEKAEQENPDFADEINIYQEEIKNQEVYLNEEVTQVIQAMNELTNKLLEY